MKTRPPADGSKKTRSRKVRRGSEPVVPRPTEEPGRSPGRDHGERSDRDAIGRPVPLDETEIGRPVQLGGVTEDTPDEEGAGTQRRPRDAGQVESEQR